MMRKKVVIGFLGTTLDNGLTEKRWDKWRPTVALFGHESFVPDAIELLTFRGTYPAVINQVASDVCTLSPGARVTQHDLAVENPWNFVEVYSALHEFAKSYTFREDTDYYVHLATGTHVAQICLFQLTSARYLPARLVDTFKDQTLAPEHRWRGRLSVIDLDLSTYDQLAQRFQKENQDREGLLKGGIITRNPAFNTQIARIVRVALKSSAPLLLTGPTGAGKSALARRVFDMRARRHLVTGAFVEVNCATLRGDNAMSTLFGHQKGAFTGATSDRPGLLRAAAGGILFLDEIGELGLDEQAMLLRALEDKRVLPLGADKEVACDFHLIAGTNRDLAKMVADGTFRADLLARINVWHFRLPGLAERPEDIEPNLDFEIERAARELGVRVFMTAEARERFLAFALTAPWPGNFRDLASAVTRMATLADDGRISAADVAFECEQMQPVQPTAGIQVSSRSARIDTLLAGRSLDRFERVQLVDVLTVIGETKSMADAGRVLYAESRTQLANPNDSDRVRKYLAKFGLDYAETKRQLA
jgi:transcriptional regulatory protein RtcR